MKVTHFPSYGEHHFKDNIKQNDIETFRPKFNNYKLN